MLLRGSTGLFFETKSILKDGPCWRVWIQSAWCATSQEWPPTAQITWYDLQPWTTLAAHRSATCH